MSILLTRWKEDRDGKGVEIYYPKMYSLTSQKAFRNHLELEGPGLAGPLQFIHILILRPCFGKLTSVSYDNIWHYQWSQAIPF